MIKRPAAHAWRSRRYFHVAMQQDARRVYHFCQYISLDGGRMASKPAGLLLCLSVLGAAPAHGAQPASAPAAPAPVALEALLPPLPLPEKGQYALQAGMFGSAAAAARLAAQLKAQRLPVQDVIAAVDQDGANWFVVAVGAYASRADAIEAGRGLARVLPGGGLQRVILLPLKPPAP
jgi:hypothetical protein